MNTFEKSCALVECYEQLENALNEIKDAINSVNNYIKELNK